MVSFWEQDSFVNWDVIIVGAGISGLSTAASLKEQNSKLRILVLERGTLPSGASTKNAGFACFGSLSELISDRSQLGDAGMLELVEKRWKGLKKTRDRLSKIDIGFEQKGGYELLSNSSLAHLNQMDSINELLRPLFSGPVFSISNRLPRFGFGHADALIFNPFEGQLHSGKLMAGLWDYCQHLGVKIITGTPVIGIHKSSNQVAIETSTLSFTCRTAALCTNAFTSTLLPQLDIQPGRGMVLMLAPKKKLPFEGIFHYDEGYYYFRDYKGKLIYGGGRNVDKATESTTDFGINENIEKKLISDLKEIILPENPFEIQMKWSGIMAFGPNKAPLIEKVSEGVYVGVRLGGMGIALGGYLGEQLSNLILSELF